MIAMQSARAKKLVLVVVLLAAAGSVRRAAAQGPIDFLRRADENGNGMLDPDELEGRTGGFIRRMAENNPRIDLSRPIPLDRLASEFERAREERMRSGGGGPSFGGGRSSFGGGGPPFGGGGPPFGGGGPPFGGGFSPFGGGPPGGGDWRGRDSGRGSSGGNESSPYGPRTTKVEPLVPGFGVPTAATPPPGFGAEGQLFTINITEEDRREAERSFRYYDRNQDGKIDAEEMGRSRYGSDLPMYDRNRDGVITMNEMEYRYARRRMENTQDSRSRSGPPGGDRREDDRRRDRSRDGAGEEQSATETDSPERKSYRRKPPIERLPEGIPDWFPRDDADGDGQIAMNEFSASWTDGVLAEYNQFDLNRDGLITPTECMTAKNQGAVRGASIGAPVSAPASSAAAPDAGTAGATPAASGSPAASAGSPAAAAARPADIDARSYDFFKQLVIKYDANNDGELTANEWANMSKNPEAADADRNGRITVEEYARWKLQR